MSLFSRGKHDRRRTLVQTTPPLRPEHTMPIPALVLPTEAPAYSRPPRPRHARPLAPMNHEPVPLPRPYVPQADASESPVREAVWLTHRASNFRFPVRCLCERTHVNTNADTFSELYASAREKGWREDEFRTWRCPRCAKRYEAALGVPPVAAIEGGAT